MVMVRLSIIIPVYNCEQYLMKCINSIEYVNKDIEIILIDDGSTDLSGEICEELSKKKEYIIVKHQNNQGVSVARNLGIDCAHGTYLWFIDADDYIAKNAIRNILSIIMDNEDADIICFNHQKIFNDQCIMVNKIQKEEKMDNIQALEFALYRKKLTLGVWDKIFKKDTVLPVKFMPDIPIGEDQTACVQFFLQAHKVLLIPENFYCYVQRETSVSNAGGSRVADKIEAAYRNYKDNALMLLASKPELRGATYSRLVFQELTVLGWMARSNRNNRELGYQVTFDIRKMLMDVLRDRYNSPSMKAVAVLAAIHYKAVIMAYKTYRSCIINKRLIK